MTVGFLTIEYEKKEKRGRRGRGLVYSGPERDFGGHVYQEKLHWFSGLTARLVLGEQV